MQTRRNTRKRAALKLGQTKRGATHQAGSAQPYQDQPWRQQGDSAHQRKRDPMLTEQPNALVEHVAEREDAAVAGLQRTRGRPIILSLWKDGRIHAQSFLPCRISAS